MTPPLLTHQTVPEANLAQAQAAEQSQPAGTPESSSVKNAKKILMRSTQLHLKIAEIRDDLVVLKNGGLRAVLKTSSMNIHLKSEDEQNAVIYGYQNFLNTLEFPIQIVVRSKKLDLDNYIEKLKGLAKVQTNPLLREQTTSYIDYIVRLIEYADIMQKEFYVVVPYDPPRAKKVTFVQKFIEYMTPKDSLAQLRQRHREFETLRKALLQRVNIVRSGLEGCGLRVEPLKNEELIGLFYECYNPRTSRLQKIRKSGELDVVMDGDLEGQELETGLD